MEQLIDIPFEVELEEIRKAAEALEARAFCYDSPGDFRAGVQQLRARVESRLQQWRAEFEERRDKAS